MPDRHSQRHSTHTARTARADRERALRADAGRAKQFMPFAALKGYGELVAKQMDQGEPRHLLDDCEVQQISQELSRVRKGDTVRVRFYGRDRYCDLEGTVKRIDVPFQTIYVDEKRIAFSDLASLEIIYQ